METLLGPVDLTANPDPSGLAHSYIDALRWKIRMPAERLIGRHRPACETVA